MAERQNSLISVDDVDLDNEFEFDPSDWMVIDDDEENDLLLQEEEKSCETSHNVTPTPTPSHNVTPTPSHNVTPTPSQSVDKKVADAADKTHRQEDSSSVRTTRSKSSNVISESTKEKRDKLKNEKLESPEVNMKGRPAIKGDDVKKGNSGETNDVNKSVPQNKSSPVKSASAAPSQSSKKLPVSKGAGMTVSIPGSDKGISKKIVSSVTAKSEQLSQSTGVASARKGSTPKPVTDEKSKAAVKRKNDDSLKTSPASVPTKVAKNDTATVSQNKCVVKDESKGVTKVSPKNNSVTTTTSSKVVKDESKGVTKVSPKNNTVTTTTSSKVVKDESKGVTKVSPKNNSVTTTTSSKVGSELNSLSSKAGNNITQAGSVKVSSIQGVLSTRASKDSSPKSKGGDIKSTTSSTDLKRQNVSTPQTSKRSLLSTENKSGEKKDDVKGVTNSQGVEGSIAEAMGVIVSENEVSSSIKDDDVLFVGTRLVSTSKADVARREQLASRKPSGDSNKSPKPEPKTTVVANQTSPKEVSKPRNSDGTSNSNPATVPLTATKKRIVRRFHRTTQTLVPQVSSKMLQCLIRIPALDSPKMSTLDVGLQTENTDNSLVHFSSDVVSVKPDTVSQEVFQEAVNFGIEEAVTTKSKRAKRKYRLRLGRLASSDVEKSSFFLKKSDAYTISFISKDCGFLDLYFGDEDDFIHVINVLRKVRFGPRYLCVTLVKPREEGDKKGKGDVPSLTATILFDQLFLWSGYLVRNKSPAWSKPRPEVYVSVHNVPEGIPLSFLSFIFPDAISTEMDDPQRTVTDGISRVKLGMARKVISNFLKLFSQVIVNHRPVILTSGLTREEDIPEMKEIIKERNQREEQLKVSSSSITMMGVARDINSNTKQPKADAEPDIIMMVDDERSDGTVLTGRSRTWNGPSTPDRLREHMDKVQNCPPRASLPNEDSGELSDISDNSDLGEEVPNNVIDLTDSPHMLSKWRQTETFSVEKDNPGNNVNCLWVGHVLPSVTEQRLNQLFSIYGLIKSIRLLPDRYCAFINFRRRKSAMNAMHQLQGTELEGKRLLIKFPDNHLTTTTSNATQGKQQTNDAVKQGQQHPRDYPRGRDLPGDNTIKAGSRPAEGRPRDAWNVRNSPGDNSIKAGSRPAEGRPRDAWNVRNLPGDNSIKAGSRPSDVGSRDARNVDRSFDRDRTPPRESRRVETREGRRDENIEPDHRRNVFSREEDAMTGRHRGFDPHRGGRRGSEGRIEDRDSQKSSTGRSDKKWPDLNDADFHKSHKVILPQVPESSIVRRQGSDEGGDLRSMLDELKSQRRRSRDSRSRDRKSVELGQRSSSPNGSRRSREVQRRSERSRSPAHQDRDRRVVRKSLSPVRRRSARSRSWSPAVPFRKTGVTAKDLEKKKIDQDSLTDERTKEWKAQWELEKLTTVPLRDPAKELITKSSEKVAKEIALGKSLFNRLMGHLKEKAEVRGPAEDDSVIEAANVYNQINNLAEQLTAIKNEVNASKPPREMPKSPPPTTVSYSQRAKEASQNLLNYYKPSVPSSSSAQVHLPSRQVDKPLGALHPDLLRYVNAGAGNKSTSPPPIPPPVAPPLFTSTSPTDKKAQLEAIAKQLATEILSDNSRESQPAPVTGGTWMVPPSEGVSNNSYNVPSVSGVNVNAGVPPTNLALPPTQAMMFCPPPHSMGPGIPTNPGLLQASPLFSMPPPHAHMVQMTSTSMMTPSLASSPMMTPSNGMPPNMWTPPPQFMPHGNNNNPRF